MADLKQATGSLFGAVVSVATTTANVFESVNDGVEMGHRFIRNAANNQAIRYDAEAVDYKDRIHSEIRVNKVTRDLHIQKLCNESKEFAKLYEASADMFAHLETEGAA